MIDVVTERGPETNAATTDERAPARRHRALYRALVIVLASAAVLLALVGFLYVFGTPQSAPPAEASPVAVGAVPAEKAKTGATVSANAEVPPADPGSPLAIEIPGCVCHSDDPALVESHSRYRMNQCAGCHVAGISMGR